MLDDPKNLERGAEQASEGLPIPKLETPSPVSSPSSSVDIEAIADKVAEKIQRDLRMAQSKKDKNAELVKKTYGINDLSELEEMGVEIPEKVKWEYRLRNLEGSRTQPESTVKTPSPGSGAALTAQDVSQIITDLQLDANDPQVIEGLRGTYRSRDHFESHMTKLALGRATKQPPSLSAAPVGSAPVSPSDPSVEQSTREYQKDMIAARGDKAKLRAIKDKAIKDGVPVDRIAFV
jgi:hypothetical protein